MLEAQYQQLTPFTSIVPLNFEAATVSHNPEGFTARALMCKVQGAQLQWGYMFMLLHYLQHS